MTDSTPSSEEIDATAAAPGRTSTGAWRILSILSAAAALFLLLFWILQSRQASDLVAGQAAPMPTSNVTVVVDRMTAPPDAAIVVLGTNPTVEVSLADNAATVEVPETIHSLIAMVDGDAALHGLAIAEPRPPGDQVIMSPRSTGEALVALSPGILDADIAGSIGSIASLSENPAFVALETALLASPNLSEENPAVEKALAAILDRVPVAPPLPDQGCDSVIDQRAYTVTGACIDPSAASAQISNEQDRWALVFAGPEPFEQVCAALMPANTAGSQITVDVDTCGAIALLTAPGPEPEERSDQRFVQPRIRDATAVHLYINFVAPWADLAGGTAGLTTSAPNALIADPSTIVSAIESIRTSDVAVADALSIALRPSTPAERHDAALVVARAMLSDDYASEFGAQSLDAAPAANELLGFFERVTAQMTASERRESEWTAPAAGLVVMGADS